MKSFNKKTDPGNRFSSVWFFFMNRYFPKSRKAGFTMIEIMIVVAIIGALLALAVPSLSTLIPRTRTKAAARDLRDALQKAKLEAIKQSTDCLIVFTEASGKDAGSCVGCISLDDDDCAGDEIIFNLDLNDYQSVALKESNFSGKKFIFNNRGLPKKTAAAGGSWAAGSATILNKLESETPENAYSFKVVVSPSGRIKIE